MPIIFSLFLFLLPLVFSFSTQQIFEVNKFTLLLISSASMCLWLSWSSYYYYQKKAFIGIFLFISLILLSALSSITPLVSIFGSTERHMGVITILCFVLVFLTSIFVIKKYSNAYILFPISFSGGFIALYAIAQQLGIDPLFGSLDVQSMSMRSFGFLGQPNFLAQSLIIPLFISFFLLQTYSISKIKKWIGSIIIILLFATACWSTDSRAGMLGIATGISIMAMVASSIKYKKILIGSIVFIPISIWMMVFIGGSFLEFSERGSSFLARHYFWHDALLLWSDSIKNIFLGIGPDVLSASWQHMLSYEAFASEYFLMMPDRVHSLWLDILTQWGLLSFLLVITGLIYSLFQAFSENKILFSGMVAMITSWSFGFFVITDMVFFCALMALIWAKKWERYEKNTITKYTTKILGIIFSIGLMLIAYITWTADKASFQKQYNQLLSAPWLENNIIRAWDTAPDDIKNKIETIGNTYHFSGRGFIRIQFLSAYLQKDSTAMQYFFKKWWESAGNNPLEKIRMLIELHALHVVDQMQYKELAQKTLATFPLKTDSSFFAQKVWKSLDNQIIWKSIGDEIELLQKTFQ